MQLALSFFSFSLWPLQCILAIFSCVFCFSPYLLHVELYISQMFKEASNASQDFRTLHFTRLVFHCRKDLFPSWKFVYEGIANVLPVRRLRQTRPRFLMRLASPSSTGVGHQRVICVKNVSPNPHQLIFHLLESDSVNQTLLVKVRTEKGNCLYDLPPNRAIFWKIWQKYEWDKEVDFLELWQIWCSYLAALIFTPGSFDIHPLAALISTPGSCDIHLWQL